MLVGYPNLTEINIDLFKLNYNIDQSLVEIRNCIWNMNILVPTKSL